jgi:carbon-monoxide dehydrogenase medium subunit
VRGPDGARTVPARELFRDALTTTLRPTELLAEIWLPTAPPGSGAAWVEFARRHGDYALVGVGAQLTLAGGVVRQARLVVAGAGGTPVRAAGAEAVLAGHALTPERLEAAAAAVRDAIRPEADIHAPAAYRRHLAGVLTVRALRRAADRAARA